MMIETIIMVIANQDLAIHVTMRLETIPVQASNWYVLIEASSEKQFDIKIMS